MKLSAKCLAAFGTQSAPSYYPSLHSARSSGSATFNLSGSLFLHLGPLLNSWMPLVFRRTWLYPCLLSILKDGRVSLCGKDRRLHIQTLPDWRIGAKQSIQGSLSACLALWVCYSTAADKLGEGWIFSGGNYKGGEDICQRRYSAPWIYEHT